jgi:hypothetical protein
MKMDASTRSRVSSTGLPAFEKAVSCVPMLQSKGREKEL